MAKTKQEVKDIAVDLDIGGTFTDCYVSYEGGYTIGKSSTTKYDVSVGALRAIEAAAVGQRKDRAGAAFYAHSHL